MEIDLYNVGLLISFISQLVSGGHSSSEEFEHHRPRGSLPLIERIHERTTEIEIPQPSSPHPRGGGRRCPEGSDKSLRESKCFIFVETAKSFIDAQSFCEQQGGNLATVRSGFDNHLLAGKLESGVFGNQFSKRNGIRSPIVSEFTGRKRKSEHLSLESLRMDDRVMSWLRSWSPLPGVDSK